jgi:hypothetical protein
VFMPFGKHKHKLVSEIPTGYLEWLTTIDIEDPDLRWAIRHELQKREARYSEDPTDRRPPPPPPPPPPPTTTTTTT